MAEASKTHGLGVTKGLYDEPRLLADAHQGHVEVFDGHYWRRFGGQNTLSDGGKALRPYANEDFWQKCSQCGIEGDYTWEGLISRLNHGLEGGCNLLKCPVLQESGKENVASFKEG